MLLNSPFKLGMKNIFTCHLGFILLLWVRQVDRCVATSVIAEAAAHSMGPIFIDEPPSQTHFSNTTGAVITCSATSSVVPVKVWWVLADGQSTVSDIAGLRYVRPNGQLVFPPFALNQYRQDIHSTTYRCMASNSFGTIRSRDCQVRAVVQQAYKMQVYDEFVIRDNTAIMRCHVPSIVRDYVRVVAWLRDDLVLATAAHPSHDGRYAILSTGELLIRNVSFPDAGSYRCQTRHRLSDELRTSEEAGRLIVTEPHNGVAPRIWTHGTVRCEHGATCELVCVAQSWPLSSYRWYRESDTGLYTAANLYSNVEIRESNVLVLRPTLGDSHDGQWVCVANNSVAEEKASIKVATLSPLEASVEPRKAQINDKGAVTFNCSANGQIPKRPPLWFHNAKPISQVLREHGHQSRVRLVEPHILHITSVHREDIGVYQCVIQSDHDEAQASAELRLGDVAPLLLETYHEKQIAEIGGSVSLRCVAIATPLPQIRWLLDDQPVPNLSRFRVGDFVTNDGKMVSFVNITNIRVVDGGEYTCMATNEVGKASFSGHLLVTGGPNLRTSFWGLHNLSVVSGLDVSIRCPVIGYPIASVVWEHNSQLLPTNHRQSIDPIVDGIGGNLRLANVHAMQDAGDYVCTVRVANADVRPMRGSVQLRVHFAPKIDRHTLPNQLSAKQGDRIKLMCSVIEGDEPVEIQWLRNGRPVRTSDQVMIKNEVDYSLLTFKSVLITDSDQWTCQARNSYATDNSSIEIIVNVPPKWTFEPKNVQVILGKSVTINCQAEGHPKPKITWKKAILPNYPNEIIAEEKTNSNAQPSEFRDILSSYRYQVFSNGSLYLQEAELNDAGLYMCQISNGIGTDLSKVIQVQVQQPPRAVAKFASENVVRGSTATLRCRAEGDPVLLAEWSRDMQPIESSQNQRYVVKADTARGSITSYLEILDTNRLDSALFTCIITNSFGSDSTNIQLIVQEPPESPRDVTISEITSRSAKLRWKPSFAGNSAIIGFLIEYKAKCFNKNVNKRNPRNYEETPVWKEFFINDPSAQSFILRDLYPWCFYELQMKAKNMIGVSEASQSISFRTAEEMPGGPPLDVSVEPLSSNSLKVKWKAPDRHLQFGQIKGYYVGYRVVEGNIGHFGTESGEQYAYKNVETSGGETTAYEVTYLTSLKKHTTYSVVVQAFNSAGAGPRSDEITVRTLNIQKQSTIVLEVITTDSNSITLHWEVDGERESSQESDFMLHMSEEGSGEWRERRLPAHQRRHVENGLKCGTKYLLYMSYRGQSTTGEVLTTRTKGTVAISPSAEEFLSANNTTVALNLHSWYNGGCPIRNFSLKYRQSHQKHWKLVGPVRFDSHDHKPLMIAHLEPNRDYILSVVAASSAGMTEAIYNFTTWNASAKVVRLTHSDVASSEYSSSAPFHNVTIMLPIVISVLVLVAVLSTLFAFMRKQDLLHEPRECISKSTQNLHLRSSSIRSKEDLNEMMTFPMSDYHSLCTQSTNTSKGKCEGSHSTPPSHRNTAHESLYSKTMLPPPTALLYSSPKRTTQHVSCGENDLGGPTECGPQHTNRPRVTVNSHHIYAEPNTSMQTYAQPRCMLANLPCSTEDSSLMTVTNVPSNDKFCALINSNTHL